MHKVKIDHYHPRNNTPFLVKVLPYINFALLLFFIFGLGFLTYRQLLITPLLTSAYPSDLVRATRSLSFQGRLTDTAQNPITSSTDVRFYIYDSGPSIVGGTLLWDSGICSVSPDQDGIFSTILGNSCGSEIPESVFSENASAWLEVEVETETLSPRQPLNIVPYAINSETVQGFPINSTESATTNTIVVMNEWGEVLLGETNPTLRAISGNFTIEGETITLQTSSGSNGDIVLSPDGLGSIISEGYIYAPGATLSATYGEGIPLRVSGYSSGAAQAAEFTGTSTATSGEIRLANLEYDLAPSSNGTATYLGLSANLQTTNTNNLTGMRPLFGSSQVSSNLTILNIESVAGGVYVDDGQTPTISSVAGLKSTDIFLEEATVSDAHGVLTTTANIDGGTATNSFGVYVQEGTLGAGSITNQYGLYLQSMDNATTNYGIYTNLGNNSFGDDILLRNDNDRIQIGASGDLDLYHDGSDSYIANATGDLVISSATDIVLTPTANLVFTGFNCSGNTNGGALTADASGVISCSDDDGGSSSLWTNTGNVLHASNEYASVVDLVIGGDSTASAQILLQANGNLSATGTATISGNITLGGQLQLGRFSSAPTQIGEGSLYYNDVDEQLYLYNSKSWVSLDPTKANKNTIHALYRTLADSYEDSNLANEYLQYESVARGVFFDTLSDGSKMADNGITAGIDTVKGMAGLWGFSTYLSSNTDTDGNAFLGDSYVHDTFYYDRTQSGKSGQDSTPQTLIKLGIDPNWHNGVTLVTATPSASVNWQPSNNLSTRYNGSLIDVSGRYATGEEDGGILITILLDEDLNSSSGPTVTYNWRTLNDPNSPAHSGTNVTTKKNAIETLETGTNDISIRFSSSVKYKPGDQFLISSWWLEPAASNDRGAKQDFPVRSHIIADANSLTIIDADTNKVWMRSTYGSGRAIAASTTDIITMHMLNGRLFAADSWGGTGTGLYELAFDKDAAYRYNTSAKAVYLGKGLSDRNGTLTTPYSNLRSNPAFAIADNTVNDVHANVINQTMVIAAGTDAGISVINEQSEGTIDLADTSTDDYTAVWVTSDNEVWGLNQTDAQLDKWSEILSTYSDRTSATDAMYDQTTTPALTSTAPTIVDNAPDNLAITDADTPQTEKVTVSGWGFIQGNGTTTASESFNYGVSFDSIPNVQAANVGWSDSSTRPSSLAECQDASHTIFKIDAADISKSKAQSIVYTTNEGVTSAALYYCYTWTATGTVRYGGNGKQIFVGTDQGMTVLNENIANVADITANTGAGLKSAKYFTNTHITEEMVGDVRGMWPLDSKYGSGLSDGSRKAETLTNAGSVTFGSTGVRGEAASLNGSSQYLHCSEANCGGTTNLDTLSTASWSFWINPDTITSGNRIIAKGTTGGYDIYFNANQSITFQINAVDELVGTVPITTGHWTHVVVTFDDTNNTAYLYLNGQLVQVDTTATTTMADNTGDFCIGGVSAVGSCTANYDGLIDEVTITAQLLQPETVRNMYQVGKAALGNNTKNHLAELGTVGATNQVNAVGIQETAEGNYVWVAVQDQGTNGDGWINRVDLSSDTPDFSVQGGSSPGIIDDDVLGFAISPSGIETTGADFVGAMQAGISLAGVQQSGNYISKTVVLPESVTSAYVWVNSYVDASDGGSSLTVSASNNGGSSYNTCSLLNTDTNQFPPEKEYVCRFTASDNDLKVRFTFARTDSDPMNYITQYGVGWTASGADLAENYVTDEADLEIGHLVKIKDDGMNTLVGKTQKRYDDGLIGIVSARPGITLGPEDGSTPGYTDEVQEGTRAVPIALSGRVPLVVSDENGLIKKGDYLTASSVPGVAMKASKSGKVVGQALEDFVLPGLEATSSAELTVNLNSGGKFSQQRILTFVNAGYYNGSVTITDTETVEEMTQTSLLRDIFKHFDSLGAASNATDSARFDSVNDFISELTQNANLDLLKVVLIQAQAVQTQLAKIGEAIIQSKLIAPFISSTYLESQTISTDLISPIGNELTIRLGSASESGSLNITDQTGNRVAQIDSQGNASLQGNLFVHKDATVAGTLKADTLLSRSARFEQLEGRLAQLENVNTQTAQIVNATISGTLYANTIDGFQDKVASALEAPSIMQKLLQTHKQTTASTSASQAVQLAIQAGYQPIITATSSSELDIDPTALLLDADEVSITADAAFINDYFKVAGIAYIGDSLGIGNTVLVQNHIQVGSSTLLSDGSLSFAATSTNNTFSIQPSGQGRLSLMAGLLTLDQSGQVKITGNLTVTGSVSAGQINTNQLLATEFDKPIQVHLATQSSQIAGAPTSEPEPQANTRFEIVNELGIPVATISAQGNAAFTSVTLSENLDFDHDDLTSKNGSIVISSKSTGKAVLRAGSNQITIMSPLMRIDSLVYITPKADTGGKTLFVKSEATENPSTEVLEGSFSVGLTHEATQDIEFNWWIVN